MVDLGFSGPRFTWTNKRGINDLIQERIDRVFVNPEWWNLFPEARVTHLTRCHLDHCPVLLESSVKDSFYLERPFKFQSFWLSDVTFPRVVSGAWSHTNELSEAIRRFTRDMKDWNKSHFGNVFAKKKRLMTRLNGIQRLWPLPHRHLLWIWRKIFCKNLIMFSAKKGSCGLLNLELIGRSKVIATRLFSTCLHLLEESAVRSQPSKI